MFALCTDSLTKTVCSILSIGSDCDEATECNVELSIYSMVLFIACSAINYFFVIFLNFILSQFSVVVFCSLFYVFV